MSLYTVQQMLYHHHHHHHVRLLKKFDRLQTNIDEYKGKYS